MIKPYILKFLKDLERNNDRTWFETHRPQYENAKNDFTVVVEKIIAAIARFDPSVSELQAKNCTFRINRDVRFSKNKAPYKNNMSAWFNKAGKKGNGAGYYVHIQPGKCFVAAGIWQPNAADLSKIRQEIDYNYEEWQKITGNNAFKKSFASGIEQTDKLTRPPRGYTEDDPAIEFLKLKSFIASKSFTDEAVQKDTYINELSVAFKIAKPMIGFINRGLD